MGDYYEQNCEWRKARTGSKIDLVERKYGTKTFYDIVKDRVCIETFSDIESAKEYYNKFKSSIKILDSKTI